MSKPVSGRSDATLFLTPDTAHPKNGRRSGKSASRNAKSHKRTNQASKFIDGIVGGERVLIAKPSVPREKGIEVQIRVALSAAGVLVMKHHVDNRGHHRTGLGLGVADLICVVPPYGRFLAIEVKRPVYTASDVRPDQTRWLAVVKRFGAVSGIATSVEEALALLESAR
jgi:hypothetical protein